MPHSSPDLLQRFDSINVGILDETVPNCLSSQSHPFDQLMHIQQGRCDVFVEGERHPMAPGDLLLVPAEAEHSVVMTEMPFVTLLVNIDKP